MNVSVGGKWAEEHPGATVDQIAERLEQRRAALESGIASLVRDLKADADVLLPTMEHSAQSAATYAAISNVLQRLVDIMTAQELD